MSDTKIKEQKIFKQLTGGDSIQAERKGKDPFTFHFKGILWFLANQLPLFGGDKGDHVYNRWILINCKNSVPQEQQIKNLQDLMFEERDSFCIKALRAFRQAIADNYTFNVPDSSKSAIHEYKRKNSSVRTFIEECCVPFDTTCLNKDLSTGKMWANFKLWCSNNNYYIPNKSEFKHELANIANVDEDDLINHTRDGDFYPYVIRMDVLNELSSFQGNHIND